MLTYQDFEKAPDKIEFIVKAINDWRGSETYKIAVVADEYEKQKNTTIMAYVKYLYDRTGRKVVDPISSNSRLCNNYFHRLNTQRCTYSLGNGIMFAGDDQAKQEAPEQEGGVVEIKTTIKAQLGLDFDTDLYNAGYYALIHGVCYIFWNFDRAYNFPVTEFCPLYDEENGKLRAGIRFWSLDWGNRPVEVVLYTEDGYTRYRTKAGSKGLDLVEYQAQRAYRQKVRYTDADGEEVVGEDNYSTLPIVPLYGSRKKQSTLVGMREKLDAYDLIQSGFANDLQDCAEIYWIVNNAMGMDDSDLAKFRDRLRLNHMAVADMDNSEVTPYTQEIPYNARKEGLDNIRNSLYEDFGALDVHTVAAGATNDHIDAAYQPMDEEADDFEYQVIQCVRQILALMGIDDIPKFKRNRISNQKEQTDMVLSCDGVLDKQTIIEHLPFITVDELPEILRRIDAKELSDRRTMEEMRKAMQDEADQETDGNGETDQQDRGRGAVPA